jgi:hypothetical protein
MGKTTIESDSKDQSSNLGNAISSWVTLWKSFTLLGFICKVNKMNLFHENEIRTW